MSKPKVEGLNFKEFVEKFRSKKEKHQDQVFSTRLERIQQAKGQIPAMFDVLPKEEVLDLLVQTFYNKGFNPADFQGLARRLRKKIDEERRKKEERRKEAQKQQEIQREPFYRFGLMIAYGGHIVEHGKDGEKLKTEILGLSKEVRQDILRKLRDGQIPQPLQASNYGKEDIDAAIVWLARELMTEGLSK